MAGAGIEGGRVHALESVGGLMMNQLQGGEWEAGGQMWPWRSVGTLRFEELVGLK